MKIEPFVLSARSCIPVAKMRPSGAWAKNRTLRNPEAAMLMSKSAGSERVIDLPGAYVSVCGVCPVAVSEALKQTEVAANQVKASGRMQSV